MENPLRRQYDWSGQRIDAVRDILVQKSRNTLFGGEPYNPNRYDRLRRHIEEQVPAEYDSVSSHSVELSLRQRYLIKRAARYVISNTNLVVSEFVNRDHEAERCAVAFGRLNGEAPRDYFSEEKIQARAAQEANELSIQARDLKTELSFV